MLYYPGPGEVEIVLTPGSIAIPLEKAPSGHLVMPIDEYERCSSVKGGTPETSLNLVAAFSKNKNKECSAKCCDETQPCEAPRGRCGSPCSLCQERPCMLSATHAGSGVPFQYNCRCALAERGEDCTKNIPAKPKFIQGATTPPQDNTEDDVHHFTM